MDKVKQFFNDVKGWGLTSLSALGIGLYFFLFTSGNLIAGICFGIFLTRNWDIIKKAGQDFYNNNN